MYDLRIDADAVVYLAGHRADSKGGPVGHSLHSAKLIMMSIINRFSPCHVQAYLTHKDPTVNFRSALYPPYKKNRGQCPKCKTNNLVQLEKLGSNDAGGRWLLKACRDCGKDDIRGTKPIYYNEIRAYLINRFGAKICKWGEADDWLGADTATNTIIASHDKDLMMIPSKHWRLLKGTGLSVSDPGILALDEKKKLKGTGLNWFVAQLLLGDAADNIPTAIRLFGDVKVHEFLIKFHTVSDRYKAAKDLYLTSGKSELDWDVRCQLMWISRTARQRFSEDLLCHYT
jgi:5'-3' exonuclease